MAYLLIIDDDDDFASATAIALRASGHEVAMELDIDNAVANMEMRRPDVAIVDVMFPEDPSAGFNLARTIRNDNDKLKGIPVLMLTAVNTKFPLGFASDDIDEDWLPVSDFMEKPVDFDVLAQKIESLLKAGK